jgi:hypothetical protein
VRNGSRSLRLDASDGGHCRDDNCKAEQHEPVHDSRRRKIRASSARKYPRGLYYASCKRIRVASRTMETWNQISTESTAERGRLYGRGSHVG